VPLVGRESEATARDFAQRVACEVAKHRARVLCLTPGAELKGAPDSDVVWLSGFSKLGTMLRPDLSRTPA